MKKVPCIRVIRERCETTRQQLLEIKRLDTEHKIKLEGEHALLPLINDNPPMEGATVEFHEMVEQTRPLSDYRMLVNAQETERALLPTSFDIVGDIAVIKIEPDIDHLKKDIANAILQAHKSICTVLLDRGVQGRFRTRDVEVIGGENRTRTRHKEYDVRMVVDLAKAYFSPRLSAERYRVAKLVKEGEIVLDMFSGVGPFSLVIGKHSKPARVIAMDLNPAAVELMKENIGLNKLDDVIEPLNLDAAEISNDIKADRIIMNLPHDSWDFLPKAMEIVKDPGHIHYYEILNTDELERKKLEIESLRLFNRKLEIEKVREVHTYSATSSYYGFDLISTGP